MTALFLVMFIDQWEKTKNHKPALIGLGCSTICLAVFGSGSFLLPSMACIILCLLAGKKENTKEDIFGMSIILRKILENGIDFTKYHGIPANRHMYLVFYLKNGKVKVSKEKGLFK